MKKQYENKHCVKSSPFNVGDHVLVKQEKKDKLTPPFNPTPVSGVSELLPSDISSISSLFIMDSPTFLKCDE
jgi:hypothetical protein